jgi:hypothetical protein
MEQSPVAHFGDSEDPGVSRQSIAYLGSGPDPPLAEELLRVPISSRVTKEAHHRRRAADTTAAHFDSCPEADANRWSTRSLEAAESPSYERTQIAKFLCAHGSLSAMVLTRRAL